jgi:Protein of unknown function (DUF3300)
MLNTFFKFLMIILLGTLTLPSGQMNGYGASQNPPSEPAFSDDELDQMLGTIALYPDPLMAQLLPAASFVDQVIQADWVLDGQVDEALIESQDWDPSVKAIAHYPGVLSQMSQNAEWTTAVGQAYVMQPAEVARSIQRLRAEAQQAGVLQSTPQQQVIVEQNVIRIEPAQAEVIYVPTYDPRLVWGQAEYSGPDLITFGSGLLIGAWLNRDWNWDRGAPYYHGWKGGGWIGRSRSHVDTRNNLYVNDQFRNIHLDRNVVNHNTGNYRTRLERDVSARRKPEGEPVRSAPQSGNPPTASPMPGRAVPPSVTPPSRGAEVPRAVTPTDREKPQPPVPPSAAPPSRGAEVPRAVAPTDREKPHPPVPPSAAPRVTTPPRGAGPSNGRPSQGREMPHGSAPQRGAPRNAPQSGDRGGGDRR